MRSCRTLTWVGAWLGVALAACAGTTKAQEAGAQPRPVMTTTVGIEGRMVYRWSGPTLRVKALGPKATVLVRLADVQIDGDHALYDLRFIAMNPGTFDARAWLERVDGGSLGDAAPSAVFTVTSTLAAEDSGELRSAFGFGVPALGGYRALLVGLGVVWAVPVGIVLWRAATRRKHVAPVVMTDAPPTLADQLRPLVKQALAQDSTAADKAALERVLIAFWREKLHLMHTPPGECLERIRKDETAATLLQAVEEWLHAPKGGNAPDVERLLEPYRAHGPVMGEAPMVDVKATAVTEGATP